MNGICESCGGPLKAHPGITLSDDHVLVVDDIGIKLTRGEAELCGLLLQRFGRLAPYDWIDSYMYPRDDTPEHWRNRINQQIFKIRLKLQMNKANLEIKNLWGEGFILRRKTVAL